MWTSGIAAMLVIGMGIGVGAWLEQSGDYAAMAATDERFRASTGEARLLMEGFEQFSRTVSTQERARTPSGEPAPRPPLPGPRLEQANLDG
jgi:hypothetical protein